MAWWKFWENDDDDVEDDVVVKDGWGENAEDDPEEDLPWITVTGVLMEDGQVRTEMDWSESFIDFLRVNGMAGSSDEAVALKYFSMMHKMMAAELGEEVRDFE